MYKVMIVDDEPNIRNGLPHLINWEEYQFSICSVAKNGDDAIKKFHVTYPDLIITDIKMPVLDGLGLLHYIRENFNDRKMFFIILSGYDDFEYAKKAIKYNVKGYLLKPVDEDELIKLLKEIYQELSSKDLFQYFYGQKVEIFDNGFVDIGEFKTLIDAIENNQKAEIEKTVNEIFNHFTTVKLHPQIIKLHIDNFFINISAIITELGGSIERVKDKDRLFEPVMIHLNVIRLKNIVLEFSINCASYIDELKSSCAVINKVKQYITKYYFKNLKLKEIAEEFYINPAYLGQLFKKETGMCFSHYLNRKRLENAKELLLKTNLPVYQIAKRVGYQNTDYFILKFKESEQLTPMEYKNKKGG